jgi:chorismate synthase
VDLELLRYLTAGESHGKGLVVIVEGLPTGPPPLMVIDPW